MWCTHLMERSTSPRRRSAGRSGTSSTSMEVSVAEMSLSSAEQVENEAFTHFPKNSHITSVLLNNSTHLFQSLSYSTCINLYIRWTIVFCPIFRSRHDNIESILSFFFPGRINIVDLQQVCVNRFKYSSDGCVLLVVSCAVCQQQSEVQKNVHY